MKILFIHEVNYESKPIFEMHEFPESLAELGHEVHFLHFPEGGPAALHSKFVKSKYVRKTPSAAGVILHSPVTVGVPLLDRLFCVVTHFFAIRSLIRRFEFDCIVTYGVPTNGLSAIFWAYRYSTPVIYRAIDVSHRIRKTLIWPLIRIVERAVIRTATSVSVNSDAMLEHCETLGQRKSGIQVHFPPIRLERFRPEAMNHRSNGEIKLLYIGTFFYFSGLDEIIRNLGERSPDDRRGLTLSLVGYGEEEKKLKNLVSKMGLHDVVHFLGYQPYAELPGIIKAHDICLNPMVVSDVSNFALPNKVLQYLACGRPVISTPLLGLKRSFSDQGALQFANSASEIIDLARLVTSDTRLAQKLGKSLADIEKFEFNRALREFENYLERVVRSF